MVRHSTKNNCVCHLLCVYVWALPARPRVQYQVERRALPRAKPREARRRARSSAAVEITTRSQADE